MSQYIEFYVKGGNEYLPIGTFSRSNRLYQIANESVNVPVYSKVAPLSCSEIETMRDAAIAEKERYEKRIRELNEQKNLIATFNNSVEEKMEALYEVDRDIEEYRDLIHSTEGAIGYFISLCYIVDEAKYNSKLNAEEYIYFGIECENPNGEEE